MAKNSKQFHIDTIASVMLGKFLTPTAQQEYSALCQHLFENGKLPLEENRTYTSPGDIPAMVMFGLIHEHPQIRSETTRALDFIRNSPGLLEEDVGAALIEQVKKTMQLPDGLVDIEPLRGETLSQIAETNAGLQQTAMKIKYAELSHGTGTAFILPGDMIIEYMNQLHPQNQEEKTHPKNVSNDEMALFQPFPELAFAKIVQQNILSIAKSSKIPVTAKSFQTITESDQGKPLLGIDLSEVNGEMFAKELENAKIGKYVATRKPEGSERALLTIDIGKLDDDFIALSDLTRYREQLSKGHGQARA